jgi:hypothetical protein
MRARLDITLALADDEMNARENKAVGGSLHICRTLERKSSTVGAINQYSRPSRAPYQNPSEGENFANCFGETKEGE